MMVLITYGTRPEYIKVKPIIDELKKNDIGCKVLYTGQHTQLLDNTKFDYRLTFSETTDNRLNDIMVNILRKNLDSFIKKNRITHVLVQGDTTSALAMALTAKHYNLSVIHLEAGLRSYDKGNPYPEEINRILISQLADIHLCATESNADNLRKENITDNIFVVGNTVLDNLKKYKSEEEYTNKVLITMHRRENHIILNKWFHELRQLSEQNTDVEFVLPIHPNPEVQKHKHLLGNKIKVVKPMSREELIKTLVKCKLVITDSGGLQEECSFFNKKCLVCRKVTERPESLDKSSFLVTTPKHLKRMFYKHIKTFKINEQSPYGDGNSAENIVKILNKIN